MDHLKATQEEGCASFLSNALELANDLFNIFLPRHASQRNADGRGRLRAAQADGLQDRRGFRGAGVAGGTGAHHQVGEIEQQGIGFNALDGQIDGIG